MVIENRLIDLPDDANPYDVIIKHENKECDHLFPREPTTITINYYVWVCRRCGQETSIGRY